MGLQIYNSLTRKKELFQLLVPGRVGIYVCGMTVYDYCHRGHARVLVVFDMDHTMVGDLVSLSDRDNIETNVPWTYWPDGKEQGLSPSFILSYLQRGMLRPGLLELLAHLRSAGATIANRLSAHRGNRVLLLEAGQKSHPWSRIPVGFARLIDNPAANWCYDSEPEEATKGRRRLDPGSEWCPRWAPRARRSGGAASSCRIRTARGGRCACRPGAPTRTS